MKTRHARRGDLPRNNWEKSVLVLTDPDSDGAIRELLQDAIFHRYATLVADGKGRLSQEHADPERNDTILNLFDPRLDRLKIFSSVERAQLEQELSAASSQIFQPCSPEEREAWDLIAPMVADGQGNMLFIPFTKKGLESRPHIIPGCAALWIEVVFKKGFDWGPWMRIILDGVDSLEQIPNLTMACTQGRKYGIQLVLVVKDLEQFARTYGTDARTILGQDPDFDLSLMD